MQTFIIAEIGSAWRFGDGIEHLSNAREAISIAKLYGADAIKFQWVSDPRKMEQRRNVNEGSYDILAWPEDWLFDLAGESKALGIEFMCTVFLKEDIAVLDPFVKRWKVASLEADDEKLIDRLSATGKPIIVSTGAMGYVPLPYTLGSSMLHCTASYPAPLDQLNLKAIRAFSGYSDHSCNVLTGAIAVACGAGIVEVHFQLEYTPGNNPDSEHSLEPDQLEEYISNIRQAELMLGDGKKKVEPCEEWALKHKVKA